MAAQLWSTKSHEALTLNDWTACYVNYISVKFLPRKKERKENSSVSLKEFVLWTWWRNYCVSLFALTTRKFKAKRESDKVFRVFVYSLLPKFILFFFLLIFPLYPSFLASVFKMWLQCGYFLSCFKVLLEKGQAYSYKQ